MRAHALPLASCAGLRPPPALLRLGRRSRWGKARAPIGILPPRPTRLHAAAQQQQQQWQQQQLTAEQAAAAEQLRQRLRSCREDYGREADAETQAWFLRDRRYDPVEAEQKLRKMLAWRSRVLRPPVSEADVAAEAATGKGFIHSHPDQRGHPVIVIRAARHRLGEFRGEDSQRFCGALLDEALARRPPGGEQLLGIFDLRGFGPANADLAFARFLVDAFFLYYPSRLAEVLLVDAPWGFQPLWGVVKPLLRRYAKLVRFVGRRDLVAQGYFTPETLPELFRQ